MYIRREMKAAATPLRKTVLEVLKQKGETTCSVKQHCDYFIHLFYMDVYIQCLLSAGTIPGTEDRQ